MKNEELKLNRFLEKAHNKYGNLYDPVEKFGGKIGFEKTRQRDIIKKNKCKLNNWTIFDIKYDYTEFDYKILIDSIKLKIKTLYTISYA